VRSRSPIANISGAPHTSRMLKILQNACGVQRGRLQTVPGTRNQCHWASRTETLTPKMCATEDSVTCSLEVLLNITHRLGWKSTRDNLNVWLTCRSRQQHRAVVFKLGFPYRGRCSKTP
jgi:hypothetical protein